MKKISFLFLAALAVSASAMAQREVLKPSGNVITRDVTVKTFDAIKAKGLYELILTQGDKEGVKVETDDNLQYLIEVSNDGSTLVIDEAKLRDRNLEFTNGHGERQKKQHFKVYVTFKSVKSMDLQIVGNTRSEGSLTFDALAVDDQSVGNITLQLTANKLTVKNKGVGSVVLNGKAENAVITNSGVGAFKGDGLIVQTMNIENSGVGHAEVNVVKDLTVKDSFLGKVKNSGGAKTHKMNGVEI